MIDGWQVQLRGRARFHMLECWLDTFHLPSAAGPACCDADDVLALGRDGEWTVLLREDDAARIARSGVEFVADRAAVARFLADAAAQAEACVQAAARPASLSDFFATYTLLQGYYQGTSPLLTAGAESELAAYPELPPDGLAVLTYGDPRGLRSFRESISWLELLLKPFDEAALRAHADTFAYTGGLSDRLGVDPVEICRERWQRDARRSSDEVAAELAQRTTAVADGLAERERLVEHLDERARSLADGLAALAVARLAIREEFTRAANIAYPAFEAVFATVRDRLDGRDGVRQLSRDEVVTLAAGEQIDLDRPRERLRRGLCRIRDGRKQLLEGAAADVGLTTEESDGPLTGLGVSGDRPVVGRVRVLPPAGSRKEQIAEAGRLAADEILVVTMTYPALVPFCARVAGIVTDFGGLTCHAAVIARSSGVPCVVGTRDATSRLRTGDLVRLDPTRSAVELLGREEERCTPSS